MCHPIILGICLHSWAKIYTFSGHVHLGNFQSQLEYLHRYNPILIRVLIQQSTANSLSTINWALCNLTMTLSKAKF